MFYLVNPYNGAKSWLVVAEGGVYTIDGKTASLLVSRKLVAAAGAFSVGGQSVELYKSAAFSANAGSYDLTGLAVSLLHSRILPAAPGSFVLTGQLAGFLRALRIDTVAGSYGVTGQSVELKTLRRLVAEAASYLVSGQDVQLRKGYTMLAAADAYAISGQAAGLLLSRILRADAGAYAVTGQDVAFTIVDVNSISFISSLTVDAQNVTMPTVQTGDFVYLADMPLIASSGSTQATPTTITGFTALVQFPITGDAGGATINGNYIWTYGRIVTNGATESGGTIVGSNLGASAGQRRKILMVFRGTSPFSSFTVKGASKVWSAGNPAPTSTDLTLGNPSFISFGNYRGSTSAITPTASPSFDGDVDSGTLVRSSYKIYNSAGTGTLAIDMADSGSSNVMSSFLVELT